MVRSAIKTSRARSEEWHSLLGQKGMRKAIRVLQKKHELRITGSTLADQRERAQMDQSVAHRLNQRNADIRKLRRQYCIPDEWEGMFFVEVVLAPIYRAINPRHEKFSTEPYVIKDIQRDDGTGEDFFRIIIGPSVDIDDPITINMIKNYQRKARKFYRMDISPKPERDVRFPRRMDWLPVLVYRLQSGATYWQIASDLGYDVKYLERQIKRCEREYRTLVNESY